MRRHLPGVKEGPRRAWKAGKLSQEGPLTGKFERRTFQVSLCTQLLSPVVHASVSSFLIAFYITYSGRDGQFPALETSCNHFSPGLPSANRCMIFTALPSVFYSCLSTKSQFHRFSPATGPLEVLLQITQMRQGQHFLVATSAATLTSPRNSQLNSSAQSPAILLSLVDILPDRGQE